MTATERKGARKERRGKERGNIEDDEQMEANIENVHGIEWVGGLHRCTPIQHNLITGFWVVECRNHNSVIVHLQI